MAITSFKLDTHTLLVMIPVIDRSVDGRSTTVYKIKLDLFGFGKVFTFLGLSTSELPVVEVAVKYTPQFNSTVVAPSMLNGKIYYNNSYYHVYSSHHFVDLLNNSIRDSVQALVEQVEYLIASTGPPNPELASLPNLRTNLMKSIPYFLYEGGIIRFSAPTNPFDMDRENGVRFLINKPLYRLVQSLPHKHMTRQTATFIKLSVM